MNKSMQLPFLFWMVLGIVSLLVVGFSLYYLPWLGILNVFLGIGTAFVLLYLVKRTAQKMVGQGRSGSCVILLSLIKSFLRVVLTAAFLLFLMPFSLLHPIGFLMGFSTVIVAVIAWAFIQVFAKSIVKS